MEQFFKARTKRFQRRYVFESEIQVITTPTRTTYGHMIILSHVVSDGNGNEFQLSFACEKKMFDYEMAKFIKDNKEGLEKAKIDMMYLDQHLMKIGKL